MSWFGLQRAIDPQAVKAAKSIVEERIKLKTGEEVLIVADLATEPEQISVIVSAVVNAGGLFTIVIQMNDGWRRGEAFALTRAVKNALTGCDVLITMAQSGPSILYGALEEIRHLYEVKKKGRWMGLHERPFSTMIADVVDYNLVSRNCNKLKEVIEKSTEAHITSKAGTDVTVGIDKPKINVSDGFPVPGAHFYAASPDGEVEFGPAPGTAEGIIIATGHIANVCFRPNEPVRIGVQKGDILEIKGGREAQKLKSILKEYKNANHICEVGIGANPFSPSTHPTCIHVEKKAIGNLHLAHGYWLCHPKILTTPSIHGDFIIYDAKLEMDGKTIIENNELLI